MRWLAERLASHGLLVQLVDPVSPADPPVVRARTFEQAQARHPLPSHSTDARLAETSAGWLLAHLTEARFADGLLCPGPQVGVPVAGTPGYSAYTATCPGR